MNAIRTIRHLSFAAAGAAVLGLSAAAGAAVPVDGGPAVKSAETSSLVPAPATIQTAEPSREVVIVASSRRETNLRKTPRFISVLGVGANR